MLKKCSISGEAFLISDEELAFYRRAGLPLPSLCPQERNRRRISYRNFRSLYHRNCSGSGKKIISMYDTDAPFPVFESSYWWSDAWNAFAYGKELDFQRPFFMQYQELSNCVPRFNLSHVRTENCSYSNMVIDSRNCYLIFGCVRDEDCMYGHIVWDCQNCIDNLYAYRCQWCSHNVDVVDCYDVHFSFESSGCKESYFMYDCANCQNCFACYNLRNKQYCFFNRQLTADAYQQELGRYFPLKWNTISFVSSKIEEAYRQQGIRPHMFGLQNENAVGNHIYNSRNVLSGFDAKSCEDSRYLFTAFGVKDSLDMSFIGGPCDYCAECLTTGGSNEVFFCHNSNNCQNCYYCEFCYSSHDLFGCNGLKNAAYCIFNKQYCREDYFTQRGRLIDHMRQTGEWGEFFPAQLAPFSYNESIAQEYMPLSRDEAIKRGLRWKDNFPPPAVLGEMVLPPATITESSDSVLQQTFCCELSGKPYRIIKAELDFYRRMRLPLPRCCPDARHLERMKKRTPRKLINSACSRCKVNFETAQVGEGRKKVYCERCYMEMLY